MAFPPYRTPVNEDERDAALRRAAAGVEENVVASAAGGAESVAASAPSTVSSTFDKAPRLGILREGQKLGLQSRGGKPLGFKGGTDFGLKDRGGKPLGLKPGTDFGLKDRGGKPLGFKGGTDFGLKDRGGKPLGLKPGTDFGLKDRGGKPLGLKPGTDLGLDDDKRLGLPAARTARQSGVAFRQAGLRANEAGGAALTAGTEPFKKSLGQKPADPRVADFVKGFVTGEEYPTGFSSGPYGGQPIPSSAGFQRTPQPTPVPVTTATPNATKDQPASLTRAPSAVGPPFDRSASLTQPPVAGAINAPSLPDGSVQVIRGTQVSNDVGGLSLPVGLDQRNAQLAAGLKNVGVAPGVDRVNAINVLRGADAADVQAGALADTAQSRLITARAPHSQQVLLPGADASKANLGLIETYPTGEPPLIRNLNAPAYVPATDYRVAKPSKTTDDYGNVQEQPVVVDLAGPPAVTAGAGAAPGLTQPPPAAPPSVPRAYTGVYEASLQYALSRGVPPAQAAQAALRAVQAAVETAGAADEGVQISQDEDE